MDAMAPTPASPLAGRLVVTLLLVVGLLVAVTPAAHSQRSVPGVIATTLNEVVLFGEDGTIVSSAVVGGRSAVAVHPTLPFVYVAVESGPNDGRMLVFRVKGATLELVSRVRLSGTVSVHVTVSASGMFLVVSHFGGQGGSVVRLRADGMPDAKSVKRIPGGGVNAKFHGAAISRDERSVFLTDIARDEVVAVQLDAYARIRSRKTVDVERGTGPRSLVIVNEGRWLVVANEYGHSVTCFPVEAGVLGVASTVSLGPTDGEPADVLEIGTTSVLVADRGPDTLVKVDLAPGEGGGCVPTVRTSSKSGGSWPRSLISRPNNEWCVGHDRGGEIVCGQIIPQGIGPGALRAKASRVWGLA